MGDEARSHEQVALPHLRKPVETGKCNILLSPLITTVFDPLLHTQDLSHLPYSSFLAALDDIAIQHPDVRRLADAATAAALEERVAIIAAAPGTSLVVRRPGSGSATNPGSRPGTGGGTDTSSGEPAGRDSPRAFSPISDKRSLTAAGGNQSGAGNARGGTRGDDVAAAAAAVASKGDRTGGSAVAKAGKKKAAVAVAAETPDAEAAEGFRSDDQRLLILLQKYVLVKSQAGKEVRASRSNAHIHILYSPGGEKTPVCSVALHGIT